MSEWIELNDEDKTKSKYPWRVVSLRIFHTGITGYFYACPYFTLSTNGSLCIMPNYIFNGNTGLPLTIEKNILPMMLTGACFHDALYQLIKIKVLPKSVRFKCDNLLYAQWVLNGTPKPVAEFGYFMVRRFGWIFV